MKKKFEPKIEIFESETGEKTTLLKRKDFEKLIDRLEELHDAKIVEKRLKQPGKPIPWDKAMERIFGKK